MGKWSWRVELRVSLSLPIQVSVLRTQVAGWSRSWRTSAALVVITDLHVGQPHGPSVPRPVADFESFVRHLIRGIHHGHDDDAIGEGDADEYMPM